MAIPIKDRVLKLAKVNWREIRSLQPQALKEIYNYNWLEVSVIKNGVVLPFFVWEDTDGVVWCVDGHTRKEVYESMEQIPDYLSAVFVEAEDKSQATKFLLEVFNQKQNPINSEQLVDWLAVEEIPLQEIEVHTLNLIAEHEEEEERPGPSSGGSAGVIKLEYTEEEAERVREALARIAQTPEAAVWELLKLGE